MKVKSRVARGSKGVIGEPPNDEMTCRMENPLRLFVSCLAVSSLFEAVYVVALE